MKSCDVMSLAALSSIIDCKLMLASFQRLHSITLGSLNEVMPSQAYDILFLRLEVIGHRNLILLSFSILHLPKGIK